MSIKAPKPRAGVDFNAAAAERGDELFSGKAGCNNCHVEPLWTEPGWNLHPPAAVCVDSFQADRAPDRQYRTSPLRLDTEIAAALGAQQKSIGDLYNQLAEIRRFCGRRSSPRYMK